MAARLYFTSEKLKRLEKEARLCRDSIRLRVLQLVLSFLLELLLVPVCYISISNRIKIGIDNSTTLGFKKKLNYCFRKLISESEKKE